MTSGRQPQGDENAPTTERPRVGSGARLAGGPGVEEPRRTWPLIAGVAVTLIAIGMIIIVLATDDSGNRVASAPSAGSSVTKLAASDDTPDLAEPALPSSAPAPASPHDAGADAAAASAESIEAFVARFHGALATATPAELGPLFDASAFGVGVGAHDLGEGRDAIVAQLREDLGEVPAKGFGVTAKRAHVASDGDIGWIAEELKVGAKTFAVTAVVGQREGRWSIAALHWAQATPTDTAYRLAREGELGIPDAIPDTRDDSPLANAMRTAFASKEAFVEARSTRADAFNVGSAAERLKGGPAIKKVFGRLPATFKLRDAVKVGTLGERGGWGVANVEFTDADRDGTEIMQTFRVLAAWVQEDAGWRIVQTQWSNPR
jgi:hypothetical protein